MTAAPTTPSHRLRLTAFCVAVGVATIVAVVGLLDRQVVTQTSPVALLALLVALVVAGLFPIELELGGGRTSFDLGHLAVAVALPTVGPVAVIAAGAGSQLVLGIRYRDPIHRTVANICINGGAMAAGAWVYVTVADSGSDHGQWLGVVLAALVADVLGAALLVGARAAYEGRSVSLRGTHVGTLSAVTDAAIGVAGLALYRLDPWAVLLLSGLPIVVFSVAHAHGRLVDRLTQLTKLNEFTRVMAAATGADVVPTMLHAAQRLTGGVGAWAVLDIDGQRTTVRVGVLDGRTDDVAEFALHDRVQDQPEPLRVESTPGPGDQQFEVGHRDAIVVRLPTAIPASIGVLGSPAQPATQADADLLATIASHAALVIRNDHLAEEVRRGEQVQEQLTNFDTLTGLPNRTHLESEIQASIVEGAPFSVLLMDLNGFKDVNDTLGHSAGDQLLAEIGFRFHRSVRRGDVLARVGGDEFALILRDVDDAAAANVAQMLVRRLDDPVLVAGVSVQVGMSVGIARFPEDGERPDVLLRCADVAMYRAKGAVSDVEFYDPDSDTHSTERLTLGSDLRRAIDAGDLTLVYQPQIDLASGQIVGVEALCRWIHPERGFVPPPEFIEAAERNGTIRQLTRTVVHMAIEQAAAWVAQGRDWRVSVNLSARNLLEDDLVEFVDAELRAVQLPPELICLEVTETAAMLEPELTVARLEQLAALGIRLSVDDFGTGHSSLVYLQRLPVTEVKIDRAFVDKMLSDSSSRGIVHAVLGLSRELQLEVVAEGIEDAETAAHLRGAGCELAQGYHFSRPVPPAEVEEWARSREQVVSTVVGEPD